MTELKGQDHLDMKILASDVLKRGLTYQGKPCKHGHRGIRYVRGGECIDCQQRYNDARKRKNAQAA